MNSSCAPSTEADIGRINIDLGRGIEDQVMMCPMMVWGGEAQRRPTMTVTQCLDRVGVKNPCVRHCGEMKNLLDKYEVSLKEVERIWKKYNT